MVALLVAALVQIGAPSQDSTYASPAVRALVLRAVTANRRVPDSLLAYQARVESEMAFIARQPDGSEQTFTIEQVESAVQWDRSGRYEQRVIGYRSQSVGFTVSAVGMFRQAWTIPVLYGNRITLLFGQPDSSARRRAQRRRRGDTTFAVHPFSEDRERVYRFSGGDTVATIRPGGRDIPIVRIHVEPSNEQLTQRTAVFRGDVELDGRRAQIVRMTRDVCVPVVRILGRDLGWPLRLQRLEQNRREREFLRTIDRRDLLLIDERFHAGKVHVAPGLLGAKDESTHGVEIASY